MAAYRAKLCIEGYLEVVGGLSIGATAEPLTLPHILKIGDPKTSPPSLSNYGQMVADDGAKLCIDGRCEVM